MADDGVRGIDSNATRQQLSDALVQCAGQLGRIRAEVNRTLASPHTSIGAAQLASDILAILNEATREGVSNDSAG